MQSKEDPNHKSQIYIPESVYGNANVYVLYAKLHAYHVTAHKSLLCPKLRLHLFTSLWKRSRNVLILKNCSYTFILNYDCLRKSELMHLLLGDTLGLLDNQMAFKLPFKESELIWYTVGKKCTPMTSRLLQFNMRGRNGYLEPWMDSISAREMLWLGSTLRYPAPSRRLWPTAAPRGICVVKAGLVADDWLCNDNCLRTANALPMKLWCENLTPRDILGTIDEQRLHGVVACPIFIFFYFFYMHSAGRVNDISGLIECPFQYGRQVGGPFWNLIAMKSKYSAMFHWLGMGVEGSQAELGSELSRL